MSEVVDESYVAICCCNCGVKFWIPEAMREVGELRGSDFNIWCPNGHSQYLSRPEPIQKPDGHGEVVRFPVVRGDKP